MSDTSELPPDHDQRMGRARLALAGLSVGDAFGGRFFLAPEGRRDLPEAPWRFSDDTAMALVVCEMLENLGRIDRDSLARNFAAAFQVDPHRGYGLSVRGVLDSIFEGVPWSEAAGQVHGGAGSMGNGGAMRVAPIGAYFADDLGEVVKQASASAEVTHAHPEGQSGAIATAVAAAWACHSEGRTAREMLDIVCERTPEGATLEGLERARTLEFDATIQEAVALLGNGSRITAPDTVPFALWIAARHIDNYPEALWSVVEAEGDNDTNAAIVGGIVALSARKSGIPEGWISSREPLEKGG